MKGTEMGKRGPKPRPEHERLSKELRVQASPAQWARWSAEAEAHGMTLSQWVRRVLDSQAEQ